MSTSNLDESNDRILDKLPGDFYSYFSSGSLKEAKHTQFNAPETLPTISRCNSSWSSKSLGGKGIGEKRARARDCTASSIHRNPTYTFESYCISRITFSFHPNRSSWTVNPRQFPLRPAYATTFNGCQGLTLARTVHDLQKDLFAHGQLYTALSRVRGRSSNLLNENCLI
ncbi:uncharacterized protein HD556DRAFT_199881 [Suillus plorans]|uniref:Uncharacterized protein n=1 Tax=Suillus plorans TaxID=116603 RepID=A0A9P7AAT9_9AGAM|nr:uncharacterized protein HD556DRAFT_199881 [Suillus plorans]KAG1784745.1 hypothetical protein HD556DRAFT_199881 [Suillus plorans]